MEMNKYIKSTMTQWQQYPNKKSNLNYIHHSLNSICTKKCVKIKVFVITTVFSLFIFRIALKRVKKDGIYQKKLCEINK